MKQSVLTGALAVLMLAQHQAVSRQAIAQQATSNAAAPNAPSQQQAIPDAPKPQTIPAIDSMTPGIGSTSSSAGDQTAAPGTPGSDAPKLTNSAPLTPEKEDDQQPPPAIGTKPFTFRERTNFVETTFTVKDSKGGLVPGIDWREVRIFENNVRQQMTNFSADPLPLSLALVIDQSVPFQTMEKVNNALAAFQGAFAPYDEVAVFTYNNGVKMQIGFTAGQGAVLGAVLERSKGKGREPVMGLGGPLSQTTVINDTPFDINTQPQPGNNSLTITAPKEYHTLNDAILAAAIATTKTGRGRRRVVYVISDGKEYGSAAKFKEVVQYLQGHEIQVYATIVGDSAIPVVGFFDRFHIPFQMRDNILPRYTAVTGGQLDIENRTGGIESSFAKITEQVRTQYTIGYYTHEPFIDGKFRKTEVLVLRPNLNVISRDGYYPSARDAVQPDLPATLPAPAN